MSTPPQGMSELLIPCCRCGARRRTSSISEFTCESCDEINIIYPKTQKIIFKNTPYLQRAPEPASWLLGLSQANSRILEFTENDLARFSADVNNLSTFTCSLSEHSQEAKRALDTAKQQEEDARRNAKTGTLTATATILTIGALRALDLDWNIIIILLIIATIFSKGIILTAPILTIKGLIAYSRLEQHQQTIAQRAAELDKRQTSEQRALSPRIEEFTLKHGLTLQIIQNLHLQRNGYSNSRADLPFGVMRDAAIEKVGEIESRLRRDISRVESLFIKE